MKSLLSTLSIAICCLSSEAQHYYYLGVRDTLQTVTGKFTVEFKGTVDSLVLTTSGLSFTKLLPGMYELTGSSSVIPSSSSYFVNPVYQKDSGSAMYVSNAVILRWKDSTTALEISNLEDTFDLTVIKKNSLFTVYYTTGEPLFVSRKIFESGKVIYCSPRFIRRRFPTHIPNDTYFNKQFYLHNTGQVITDGQTGTADADIDAPEAWDISKGRPNIVIAVIDEGVSANHPDLPILRQVRDPGSNLVTFLDGRPDKDPSPGLSVPQAGVAEANSHGDNVAGIIAASMDNNSGITGLAPGCKIMPIKITYENIPDDVFAAAVVFAKEKKVNIINGSIGGDASEAELNAVEAAIKEGIVCVYAIGNNADNNGGISGSLHGPVTLNLPGLIAVGASDRHDKQANYSPTTTIVDLVAPSHSNYSVYDPTETTNVWTTDTPFDNGLNPIKKHDIEFGSLPAIGEKLPADVSYTARFGGTSAATPQVAGVVALMLSVNPTLTPAEVETILKSTAEKVNSGLYNYNYNSSKPGHSKEMGYGRLNAYQAVLASLVSGTDLYLEDNPEDSGVEPNDTEPQGRMWISHDIRVSPTQTASFEEAGFEVKYYADPTRMNYVFVRVRNRGNTTSSTNNKVQLYFNKASLSSRWPKSWNGEDSVNGQPVGGFVGEVSLPPIAPGMSYIAKIPMKAPDPLAYGVVVDANHFCLLARIVEGDKPDEGLHTIETECTWCNIQQNNNIASINFIVIGDSKNPVPGIVLGGIGRGKVNLQNFSDTTKRTRIAFEVPESETGNSVFDYGTVKVQLEEALFNKWMGQGSEGHGVTVSWETGMVIRNMLNVPVPVPALIPTLLISEPKSHIVVTLDTMEHYDIVMVFQQDLTKDLTTASTFLYDVRQLEGDSSSEEVAGGERYIIQNFRTTIDNASGVDELSGEQSMDLLTGFGETADQSYFTVRPNPADEFVDIDNLQGDSQEFTVDIYDLPGRLLYRGTGTTNLRVDLSGLSAGLYSLVLARGNNPMCFRLLQIE